MVGNNKKVVITAVGDCLGYKKNKDNGNPFEYVRDIISNADLRFMNLETVLTDEERPVAHKWVYLRTNSSAVRFIKALGIDIVNLAHNHIKDYGPKGFNDTLDYLKQANIPFVGVGKTKTSITQPVVFHLNGLKVAFLGFFMYNKSEPDKGIFIADISEEDETIRFIQKLSKLYDLIIVSLHWGTEHIFHPSPGQIEFAHRLIDNGVHLIIGHHSHCVQGIEHYKNGLIAYSLGNFNFWQPDVKTKWFNRLSVILRVELTKNGILKWELTPTWIKKDYSPVPIFDKNIKKKVLAHYNHLSRDITSGKINWKDWYEEMGWIYFSQTLKGFIITIPKYGFSRFKEMIRWMGRAHTKRAIAGAIGTLVKNRKLRPYRPIPIIPNVE